MKILSYKIEIELSEKEKEKLDFLLEETGVRTGADLLVYLLNKEYRQTSTYNKLQTSFTSNPGVFIGPILDTMKKMDDQKKMNDESLR